MPQYVIERDIAGAGALSAEELRAAARKSCEVLAELAPRAQWQHSYFTHDKVFCVYIADDEDVIKEHAERGGFPLTHIRRISTVTTPLTSEE